MHSIKNIRLYVSFYSDSKGFDLNQKIEAIKYRYAVFENVFEIYNHIEYLPAPISLKNAIEFHCMMGGKQVTDFSKFFLLEDQVEKYGNTIIRDVPFEIKKLISVLLYIYLNEICIFHDFNLLATLEQMKKNDKQKNIFDNYVKQLQLVYFQPENANKNHYLSMDKYFNSYAIIENNGIRCFSSKEEYGTYLK